MGDEKKCQNKTKNKKALEQVFQQGTFVSRIIDDPVLAGLVCLFHTFFFFFFLKISVLYGFSADACTCGFYDTPSCQTQRAVIKRCIEATRDKGEHRRSKRCDHVFISVLLSSVSSSNPFFSICKVFFFFYCSYHVVGPISDGLVTQSWDALLGVAVTGAAALHYQVVNGKMLGGERFLCSGAVFGLARTRLMPQQADSDVGHFELPLSLVSERIQGLPLWKAAVDHL